MEPIDARGQMTLPPNGCPRKLGGLTHAVYIAHTRKKPIRSALSSVSEAPSPGRDRGIFYTSEK